MIYERKHTYELKKFGGLATPMPIYATFFLVAVLSSVGLPLLNGFVGEFLVLSGAAQSHPHGMFYAVLGTTGVIWSAAYLLWMYQRVFYGPMHHEENRALPDIGGREQISLWPLMAMALIMGVASPLWMKTIDPAVSRTLPPASSTASVPASTASLAGTTNGLQK
jgi:NADH-quinone oxidoreductase subunit M